MSAPNQACALAVIADSSAGYPAPALAAAYGSALDSPNALLEWTP